MTYDEFVQLTIEMRSSMPGTMEGMEEYLAERGLPSTTIVTGYFESSLGETLSNTDPRAIFIIGLQIGHEIRSRQE